MRVHLEYGRAGLDVDLPDGKLVKRLGYRPVEPLADPRAAVRRLLERPTAGPSLAELARGRRDACVLICDITRPVPNAVLLPPVLETLQAAGIDRNRIRLLIATGLHRPNTPNEWREMVGPEIVGRYRIENHHGQDLDEHVHLGETPSGTPVWIDRRWIEAELKLSVGLIEPHLMAGFSGGRKLICPGIAALPTVRAWHGPRLLEHPSARNGCLEGNPIHEENTRIARMAGCDFILNCALDADRRIVALVAGEMEAAFEEGVRQVRGLVRDTLAEPVDVVLTTAAGHPLDATYYQAIKGMVGAVEIVKPYGTIIIAAALAEGIGSAEFQSLFDDNASLEGFMERITSGNYFVMDQWQLEELAKVRRKARVVVVSDGLSPDVLRRLFVEPAASVETAVADALARHGPGATLAVIPKGPYVLAELGT